MTQQTKQPITTIRDRGGMKANIWENDSRKGTFFSVEVSRTYKAGETFKDSHSFPGSDILIARRLLDKAYDAIADLEAAQRGGPL